MPDSPILFLVLGGLILGFGAWAGWTVGARRARKPNPLPDRLWLCDACHSFNEPEREVCYGCHRPRAMDARSVVPDAEFHIDQRFGRASDGAGWGSSRSVVPPADEAPRPPDEDATKADATPPTR